VINADRYYGYIRDENLRLVYANVEEEFIKEKLFKYKLFIGSYLSYVLFSIAFFMILYLITSHSPRINTLNILFVSNIIILTLVSIPFCQSLLEYRRYVQYQLEHQKFLAKYRRKASPIPSGKASPQN
jgi:uncharacterized membrane protein YqjE